MKNILKSLLFLLIGHVALAQKIEIGAKGSFNLSNVSKFDLATTILPDFKLLPSAGGAIFAEIPIGSDFSFRPEVGYLERGSQLANINLGGIINNPLLGSLLNVDVKVVLKYIEVPLLVKYKFLQSDNSHAYLLLGPSLAFKIDDELKGDIVGFIPVNFPLNFNYNKVDVGGHVGAGYKFPLAGKVNAFIEAKYQQGFSKVIKDIGFIDTKTKNKGFGISAGISIPLGL